MPATPLLSSAPALILFGLFLEGAVFLWMATNNRLSRKNARGVLLGLFLSYGIGAFIMFLLGNTGAPISFALAALWFINLVVTALFVIIDDKLHPDEVLAREKALM